MHGDDLRRRLWCLLDGYRGEAARRTQLCGRGRYDWSVTVARNADGRATVGGLVKCRSKACPVCLARRRTENAALVSRAIAAWCRAQPVARRSDGSVARGDDGKPRRQAHVYLLTMTIRHGAGDDLAVIGGHMRDAWRAVVAGKQWHEYRKQRGLEYIVAQEVTHGAHGWHPHLHAVLLSPVRLDIEEVREYVHGRWCRAVQRHIGAKHVPDFAHGVDLRPCHAAEYVSKLGMELSAPGTKQGKGRSPLELLSHWVETPKAERTDEHTRSLRLYGVYARAMRGVRDLTWSRGLRPFRDLAGEMLAGEREAAEGKPVALIDGPDWDWFCDAVPHPMLTLFRRIERAPPGEERAALRTLFAEHGRALSDNPRSPRAAA